MYPIPKILVRLVLLAIAFCVFSVFSFGESSVSIKNYRLQGGEALLQVLRRPAGGSYLVIVRGQAGIGQLLSGSRVSGSQWIDSDTFLDPTDPFSSTTGVTIGDSRAPTDLTRGLRIVRLDGNDREISAIDIRVNHDVRVARAVVGTDGSLYLAGYTAATDFPSVQPAFPLPSQTASEGTQAPLGFILKTNPTGSSIERSTRFGGTQIEQASDVPAFLNTIGTRANDITLDGAGNVYVTGTTSHVDFPVSDNAAKRDAQLRTPPKRQEGFLVKLDRGLSRVIFSTFFGTDSHVLASCADPYGTTGLSVRVGMNNEPIVYASVTGKPLETTNGAYTASNNPDIPMNCIGSSELHHLETYAGPTTNLIRFSNDGSRVTGVAYLGRSRDTVVGPNLLQLTSDRNVIALLPVLQMKDGGVVQILKLDTSLSTRLAQSTYEVTETGAVLRASALQPDGSIWLSGDSIADLGTVPEDYLGAVASTQLGRNFLLQIEPLHLKTRKRYMLPAGTTLGGLRADNFQVHATSWTGIETSISSVDELGTSVLGVVNAAGEAIQNSVSPYEFLSLYGVDLTTGESSGTSYTRHNSLPTTHNGVRVLIDGVACPLLYAGSNQINLIAPGELASIPVGSQVEMAVELNGQVQHRVPLFVSVANPWVFPHGADPYLNSGVFNGDGSPNTAQSPLLPGSHLTLYMNGAGAPVRPIPAGQRVEDSQTWSSFDIKVTHLVPTGNRYNGATHAVEELEGWTVSYLGSIPGLAAGTLQLNMQTANNSFIATQPYRKVVYIEFWDNSAADPKLVARFPIGVWLRTLGMVAAG